MSTWPAECKLRPPLPRVLAAVLSLACGCAKSAPELPGDAASPLDGGATRDSSLGAEGDSGIAVDAAAALDGPAACDDGGVVWSDPGAAPPTKDPSATVHQFFAIGVVDQTAAPVVGATLTTTNATTYVTDQNGKVAYYEPGLMGTDVWFTPACSGYSYPADGLGNVGTALHPTEGGTGTITMSKTGPVAPPSAGDLQTRLLAGPVPGASKCMALRSVDSATMRGVPLVSFVTSAGDAYWSDSQGMVAYCDPDEFGNTVVFTVTSDGYALASGSTVTVDVTGGGAMSIPLVRELPGQRLYRVTGQGIYRDSALLGLTMPTAHPNINGLVMGQDTPSTFVYGGQLYWIWQDTSRAAYPLGNFASSGATSPLPDGGGLSPDVGVNTSYFVGADGFSRAMVNPAGDPDETSSSGGPIWLGRSWTFSTPRCSRTCSAGTTSRRRPTRGTPSPSSTRRRRRSRTWRTTPRGPRFPRGGP